MSAVWMRARADLRQRGRSAMAIVLLVALGGGLALSVLAGARRTDTAYPRLLRENHGAQAFIGTMTGAPQFTAEQIAALPDVVSFQPKRFYLLLFGDQEKCDDESCVLVAAASGPAVGEPLDEQKLLDGRLADPTKPDEVVLTVTGRERPDLKIGMTFTLKGVPFEPRIFKAFADRAAADPLTMRVVGVVATPGDFPPQLGDETVSALLTPAFYDRYPEPSFGIDGGYAFGLRRGANIAAFRTATAAAYDGEVLTIDRTQQDANVQRSMHLQAQALGLLGAFLAIVALVLLTQTVSRDLFLGADDSGALASLGMSRMQRWGVGMLRSALLAISGAGLAVVVAVLASPLMPVGLARDAEPSPGLAFDVPVLLGGALLLVVIILLVSAPLVWRYVRAEARVGDSVRRLSVVVGVAARLGLPASGVAGVRLALERGRGASAVPVRATLGGLAAGIAALVAAFTFASSLSHLIETPKLYGVPWDVAIGQNFGDFRAEARTLAALPGVDGLSIGTDNIGFLVGDEEVAGIGLDPIEGAVSPPLITGRAPSTDPVTRGEPVEMVLGQKTLKRLGLAVGDAFAFTIPGAVETPVRSIVVGSGVIPTSDDSAPLGDAAWFSTLDMFRAVGLPDDPTEALGSEGADQAPLIDRAYVTLARGATESDVFRSFEETLGFSGDELWRPPVGTPADLVSFGRVRNLPAAIGGGLGLLAAAILVNTLVSSIRRRRRDIAILKTLGFSRRQVRTTVSVQASVLAMGGCLIGLPAGLAAGRWLWTAYAGSQGFIAQPVAPVLVLLLAVPVSLLAANLIAILPGRAAARTQPALVLKAE